MLCEICKEKEATLHLTKIVNGVKEERHICEDCAKKEKGINIINDLNISPSFSFQNILSGFLDYMNSSTSSNISNEIVCENCGKTYREFKESGLLGCENCYSVFKSSVLPIIKRVQLSTEHCGKIPVKSGKYIIKQKEIIKLKEELQKAIAIEEYEKAAEIRDKIKELEK